MFEGKLRTLGGVFRFLKNEKKKRINKLSINEERACVKSARFHLG